MSTKMPGKDAGSLRYGATKDAPKGAGSRETPIVASGRGAKGDTGSCMPRNSNWQGPGKK